MGALWGAYGGLMGGLRGAMGGLWGPYGRPTGGLWGAYGGLMGGLRGGYGGPMGPLNIPKLGTYMRFMAVSRENESGIWTLGCANMCPRGPGKGGGQTHGEAQKEASLNGILFLTSPIP